MASFWLEQLAALSTYKNKCPFHFFQSVGSICPNQHRQIPPPSNCCTLAISALDAQALQWNPSLLLGELVFLHRILRAGATSDCANVLMYRSASQLLLYIANCLTEAHHLHHVQIVYLLRVPLLWLPANQNNSIALLFFLDEKIASVIFLFYLYPKVVCDVCQLLHLYFLVQVMHYFILALLIQDQIFNITQNVSERQQKDKSVVFVFWIQWGGCFALRESFTDEHLNWSHALMARFSWCFWSFT